MSFRVLLVINLNIVILEYIVEYVGEFFFLEFYRRI